MTDGLLAILDGVVAQASGGEAVEVFGIDETDTTIKAYGGQVESLSSARTRGVGIRVIAEGGVGYAYTADTSEAALSETLLEARVNARVATADDANVLPQPAEFPEVPGLFDPAFVSVTPEQKVELALRLESLARAGDSVKGVDSATYGDSDTTVAIAS